MDFNTPLDYGRDLNALTWKILEGILHIHSKNIVHRDLKSENVMINHYGDIKIIDFGISLCLSEATDSSIIGSPLWMAPEVIRREPHGFGVFIPFLSLSYLYVLQVCVHLLIQILFSFSSSSSSSSSSD